MLWNSNGSDWKTKSFNVHVKEFIQAKKYFTFCALILLFSENVCVIEAHCTTITPTSPMILFYHEALLTYNK